MLKVVIADDEERICRLVQMLVDWNALGMEVIGTAANGLEALDLVESLRPDILITDIRMPGCDGLELVEKVRAILPYLEIALISGYAQFEYAQIAMHFDVGGYILKPIKKDVLTSTLEKLGNKCRERTNSVIIAERLHRDSYKSGEILRSRLLEDLLNDRIGSPSREDLKNKYLFTADSGSLQVFILKMDCSPEFFSSPTVDIIKKNAREILESAVAVLCETFVFQFHLSAGYGIISFEGEKQAQIRRTLRECLNQLQAHKFGAVEFSLAVGKAGKCSENFAALMRDAQIAIAERLLEGTGRMLEVEMQDSPSGSRKLLEKYSRIMQRAVNTLSTEEADLAVDELFGEIQKVAGLRGYVILDLIITAGKMFTMCLSMDEGDRFLREYEERCALYGSTSKLFDCLRRFQREQIEAVKARLESEAMRPIRIAKQYIARHFSEPITLDDVCTATGFSVSYFSTIFKKETGEGFSKYLMRIRIERAKELLQDTNLPVAEICELVGYSDIKHFTGIFKKMTSLNPGQYRKLYG